LALVQCLLHLIDGGLLQLEAVAQRHWKQLCRAGILLQREDGTQRQGRVSVVRTDRERTTRPEGNHLPRPRAKHHGFNEA
jgi:hypothetical protein